MKRSTRACGKGVALPAGALSSAFAFAAIMLLAASTVMAQEPAASPASELSTQETVQQTAEAVAEKVAVKIVEKAAEKAAEEKAVIAENTSKRPASWYGPTRVTFMVFVVDIDDINDDEQNFTANVYLRLQWQDPRLATPEALPRRVLLEDVWNPRVLLANQQGIMAKSLPEVVQVAPDGTVTYHQRYTGRLSQPLRLFDFPMDRHPFEVRFVGTGYSSNDLEFAPDEIKRGDRVFRGGAMAAELSLPNWQVLSSEALTEPYNPVPGLNTASFVFRFEAKRYIGYFLWQVVLPLIVVVVMSWAAFWIDAENVGARTSVATSSILTLIALRFVLASLLPRLPYMTRMDYLTVGSTILVLMAMIVVLTTSLLRKRRRRRTDRLLGARWFPRLVSGAPGLVRQRHVAGRMNQGNEGHSFGAWNAPYGLWGLNCFRFARSSPLINKVGSAPVSGVILPLGIPSLP